jgi:hypothetical protein
MHILNTIAHSHSESLHMKLQAFTFTASPGLGYGEQVSRKGAKDHLPDTSTIRKFA